MVRIEFDKDYKKAYCVKDEDELSQKEKGKESEKSKNYKNFTTLLAYKELSPLLTKSYEILMSYKRKEENKEYEHLLGSCCDFSLQVLLNLADGYNKYYAEDKLILYNLARSNFSKYLCMLLIILELKIIPEKVCKKLFLEHEEKTKLFNGLIKKIEAQI